MSLTVADRRKLNALRNEGYFDSTLLSRRVLAVVKKAADQETRPEWLEAFLMLNASGEGTESECLHQYTPDEDTSVVPLFAMLGRKDPEMSDTTKRVLVCWLRRGLGARVKDIAAEIDVDASAASRVRNNWEWEIRGLLQDAKCLGVTGEDLYMAVTTPHYVPTRLLQRLTELRLSRTENEVIGPAASQYETEIKNAWFDYRVEQGLRGKTPDMPIYPPKWFVKSLISK